MPLCWAHLLLTLLCVAAQTGKTLSAKQKIYYGQAHLLDQLLANTSEWIYVQQNADGYYLSFGQLTHDMIDYYLPRFFKLFPNKTIYFESDVDPDHQPLERDKTDIGILHNVGWTIVYTSQNYGWTVERDQILGYYNLTEHVPRRPDFVQLGPWLLSGNISNDPGTGHFTNAQYRGWINQSNGVSTDGPMGFWSVDFQKVREGSFSTVQYAHHIGRPAAVMICPYAAGVVTYNSTRDYLTVGISAIQEHEDNDADPDIWIFFEYGDLSISPVPEQINGYPANSTTGMAYYALKHRDGEPQTLDLYMDEGNIGQFAYVKQSMTADMILKSNVPVGTILNYTLHVADYSPWLDYAACLRVLLSDGQQDGWNIRYSLNEVDITAAMTSTDGFVFNRENRVRPNSIQSIIISFTRTFAVHQNMTLTIQLAPHRGSDVVDSLQIMTKSTSSVD
jgi:hypothetical protein